MLIKKNISKFVKIIYIPFFLSGASLMIFEKELNEFKYITLIRWFVLVIAIIIVLSSILDIIIIIKKRNK